MSEIFEALRKAQRDAEAEGGPEDGGQKQEAGVPDSPQHPSISPPSTSEPRDSQREQRSHKHRIPRFRWSWRTPRRNGRDDSDPLSAFSLQHGTALGEQFRILRTHVESTGPGTIMVTSAVEGEGKTICAANLARTLAMGIDSEVLLIDADLRRPSAAAAFNLRSRPGLVDYLVGESDWRECVQRSGQDRLSVLPAGASSALATELLGSERMQSFIAELKSQLPKHYLVIDAPPLLLSADPLVLARHMDRVLLVVRADVTPREAVVKAIETLGPERFIGIVLNGTTQRPSHYAFNRYYYGRDQSTNGAATDR